MILICSCFGAKKKKSIIRGVEFSVNEQKGKKKKVKVKAFHCGHLPAPLFFFLGFFFFSIIHIFPLSLSLSFWPSSVFFAFFFFKRFSSLRIYLHLPLSLLLLSFVTVFFLLFLFFNILFFFAFIFVVVVVVVFFFFRLLFAVSKRTGKKRSQKSVSI